MGAIQKCRSVKSKFWLFFILLLFLAPIYSQEVDSEAEHPIVEINKNLLLVKSSNLQKVILQFPDRYDSEKEYPLLVVLHGNGGAARHIANVFLPFSKEDVILAFPQGQYPKSVMGAVGYSWYLETKDRSVWEIADTRSLENVYEVIVALNSKYKIDKNFVFGFSQGASLAYMVGFKHPDLVSGVIAVGGRMPDIDKKGSVISSKNIEDAKLLRVLVARGNADKLTGEKQFNYQRLFLKRKGYDLFSFEYDGGHYLSQELLEEVFDWIQ